MKIFVSKIMVSFKFAKNISLMVNTELGKARNSTSFCVQNRSNFFIKRKIMEKNFEKN